jgi:hypothetical protein
MIEVVTAISVWELAKHAGSWLTNLKRQKVNVKKKRAYPIKKTPILIKG